MGYNFLQMVMPHGLSASYADVMADLIGHNEGVVPPSHSTSSTAQPLPSQPSCSFDASPPAVSREAKRAAFLTSRGPDPDFDETLETPRNLSDDEGSPQKKSK